MTRRVLLEVTEFRESRQWYRHLSGVPRTVMEIGRRLLVDESLDVECVYFNAAAGEFYVADRSLFSDALLPDDPAPARSRARDLVSRARRRVVRGAAAALPRGAYRSARRSIARARGARPLRFRPDDTVMVLGAMWGSRALPDALAREKERVGFRVHSLIYDLIPVEYPQVYEPGFPTQYRHYLDRVLAMSSRLLVISDATRRSVEKYCAKEGVAMPPTSVIVLGDGAAFAGASVRPAALSEGDFVLAVSTFEPRKNHEVLYRAVKHAQTTGIPMPRIVVAGNPGWLTDELQAVVRSDPSTQGSFIWLPNTTDAELAWLYEHALFTVYPSIAEGWGLPIAESMRFGRFCITSSVSSMPEVAGDLADYLSPYDPAAWAAAISEYGRDRRSLAEREARIKREYVPRSWDDAVVVVRAGLPV